MFATSCIAGNLTSDPELKTVGTNHTELVKFTIAVNDRSGGEEKSYFFDCQAWGGRAKAIADNFRKGDRIAVTCDMRQERWEDRSTGQKRKRDVHNVVGLMFNAPGKTESPSSKRERVAGKSSSFSASYGQETERPPLTTRTIVDYLPLSEDDDIPF